MRFLLAFLAILALTLSTSFADDWPGWRGPNRDGISKEKGLLKVWPPKVGPKLLWQSDKAGLGYSGMAVVGDVVYTMGAFKEDEYLIAFDSKGAKLWETKVGPVLDWAANQWSRGPNSTPTVDGDRIYAMSSKGMLVCANRKDGKPEWTKDLHKELKGRVWDGLGGFKEYGWGYTWSPLIDGDNLILTPGGAGGLFAALDKKEGKVLWRSKAITEPATYATAAIGTIGGVKQYVYTTQKGVAGVAAADGELLWFKKRDEEYPDIVTPTPIISGDSVFASAGAGGGSERFTIKKNGAKWEVKSAYADDDQKGLMNYEGGGVVKVGDYLYGYHEDQAWKCLDFATGKVVWPKGRVKKEVTHGGIVVAEDRIYTVDDKGTVAMIDASPKAFKILSMFKLPAESKNRKTSGKIWTHPSLSNGKLYLRDQELLFCYEVK